ncbi:MAG: class I tRNA ligase family protein, partial [Clostridia bacterium]|nr:class I tRNA ligase family protein [Clostridia bacterium]
ALLQEKGALLHVEKMQHSYPCCWRHKTPIIFRATPQWFCSVESFKEQAIKAIENVKWYPAWGEDRMISMIRERADWCISRQRRWGLPIPVFYCKECGKPVSTPDSIAKISALFDEHGSNVWFEHTASELIPEGFTCPHCGGKEFEKETDTLDCWFDSGSTHYASLMKDNPELWPADVYLEGADQYRGWFQSSLLTSVGALDKGAPFKQVLTHGWVVDGQGRAMHKSLGNGVDPADLIKNFGADIVRLWAASSDYHADVRCSQEIFKQLSESYRKIRNTIRILLANLGSVDSDFDPKRDLIAPEALVDIDKWALSRLNKLVKRVREAYDEYQFHIVYHDIHNFCSIDMSKLYIDITKDRLYCETKNDPARRSAQTAMYIIVNSLTKLLAPILSFTAEETWSFMSHAEGDDLESVFCNEMPAFEAKYDFSEIEEKYESLFNLRDGVMKALELARAEKTIGKSLEAAVTVYAEAGSDAMKLFTEFESILPDVFIVSKVSLCDGDVPAEAYKDEETGIAVKVTVAEGEKCVRCWMQKDDCAPDEDGQHLCARCRKAVC